jgi:CheY-like chemotaxis protein
MLIAPSAAEMNAGADTGPAEWLPDDLPGSHSRIRETARTIEDRIRRVLVPPGSAITTLRFLVVDDHPDAADALAAVLDLIGCQVRTCYDAGSALHVAGEFRPQVCLLDLKMPGMDGFDLAAHLQVQAGGGPRLFIATTAFGDPETREKSQRAGFHLHLTKPVDVPTLLDATARLWEVASEPGLGSDPPAPP